MTKIFWSKIFWSLMAFLQLVGGVLFVSAAIDSGGDLRRAAIYMAIGCLGIATLITIARLLPAGPRVNHNL